MFSETPKEILLLETCLESQIITISRITQNVNARSICQKSSSRSDPKDYQGNLFSDANVCSNPASGEEKIFRLQVRSMQNILFLMKTLNC